MPKKLLLIDNYDSFTYNLVQYFQQLGLAVTVKRNDEITLAEAVDFAPDFLVFSPGPGTVEKQSDIGVGPQLFNAFRGQIPILGVCLGHQMMGQIFGGKILKIEPQHGKRWPMKVLDKSGLFKEFNDSFEGMRYHSMVVKPGSFDKSLKVTAVTDDEHHHIMAFEKPDEKLFAVQFHPESIGTKEGLKILENFIND
jgi:anthranilate synthase/aminodeoxychorismate synthase-like glutamine amidotransferase